MEALVIHATETAQWHALVNEAQKAANQILDEELESYLVFLLMRFTQKPALAASVLATEYLESLNLRRNDRQDRLRDVGDRCLLFSGLFPHRANRKRVKISYFVDLGRTAYHQLGSVLGGRYEPVYTGLAQGFVRLMDILHTMRQMDRDQQPLSPLQALELWRDTGSQFAYQSIQSNCDALPVTGNKQIN